MEYGLISLLVIQVAACLGCLVAWLRIRTEVDRIKDRSVTEDILRTTLDSRLTPIILKIDEAYKGLQAAEIVTLKSATDAAAAVQAAKDMDDWERRLLSVQNSLAALKRHRTPKAEAEEPEEVEPLQIEPPPQEPPYTPPLIRGRDMRTFGQVA